MKRHESDNLSSTEMRNARERPLPSGEMTSVVGMSNTERHVSSQALWAKQN